MNARNLLILAALGGSVFAADPPTPNAYIPNQSGGMTTVTVPTTASELAAGYAAAVQQMSLKSLVIYMHSGGKIVPIRGIRSAKALSGVLLITFSTGDVMAVNAEQIVMITDGNRTP